MRLNSTKYGFLALLISLTIFISHLHGGASCHAITETEAIELVRTICEQYYLPLGSKGRIVVFIEVSTSTDPWSGGGDSLKLDDPLLSELSSTQVRFLRDQDLSNELDKISTDVHVMRATFYPFAASFSKDKKQLLLPVKNGDIQKWRQCMYVIASEHTGWKLISVEQK